MAAKQNYKVLLILRSKRSCCGGDGGFGSVKFSESSDPREDVISTEKVETTNGRLVS